MPLLQAGQSKLDVGQVEVDVEQLTLNVAQVSIVRDYRASERGRVWAVAGMLSDVAALNQSPAAIAASNILVVISIDVPPSLESPSV
jgi:hypothetical protein